MVTFVFYFFIVFMFYDSTSIGQFINSSYGNNLKGSFPDQLCKSTAHNQGIRKAVFHISNLSLKIWLTAVKKELQYRMNWLKIYIYSQSQF